MNRRNFLGGLAAVAVGLAVPVAATVGALSVHTAPGVTGHVGWYEGETPVDAILRYVGQTDMIGAEEMRNYCIQNDILAVAENPFGSVYEAAEAQLRAIGPTAVLWSGDGQWELRHLPLEGRQ